MPDSEAPDTAAPDAAPRGAKYILTCLAIGLLAGLLSGLFGVGGGTVIVPLLVLVLALNQRLAAGTSLAAIIPIASVGVISYALNDSVAWIPGLILAAGAVVGAQIGTWLLPRVSLTALRWSFIGFLVAVIISLFIVVPSRDAGLPLNLWTIGGLVVLGVATGTVAGLIGVGGGIVVVPASPRVRRPRSARGSRRCSTRSGPMCSSRSSSRSSRCSWVCGRFALSAVRARAHSVESDRASEPRARRARLPSDGALPCRPREGARVRASRVR
jgi:hypothetical protein